MDADYRNDAPIWWIHVVVYAVGGNRMKSLLIIGTPKNCGDCPCAGEEFGICQADEKHRDCDWYKIPSWCPLKPMPLKRETHVYWKSVGIGNIPTHEISDYDKGWNDCVEFLEGESND